MSCNKTWTWALDPRGMLLEMVLFSWTTVLVAIWLLSLENLKWFSGDRSRASHHLQRSSLSQYGSERVHRNRADVLPCFAHGWPKKHIISTNTQKLHQCTALETNGWKPQMDEHFHTAPLLELVSLGVNGSSIPRDHHWPWETWTAKLGKDSEASIMDIDIDRLESFDGGIFRWNLSFFKFWWYQMVHLLKPLPSSLLQKSKRWPKCRWGFVEGFHANPSRKACGKLVRFGLWGPPWQLRSSISFVWRHWETRRDFRKCCEISWVSGIHGQWHPFSNIKMTG